MNDREQRAEAGPIRDRRCRLLVCRYDADQPLLDSKTRRSLIIRAQGKLEVVFFSETRMLITKYNRDTKVVEEEDTGIDPEVLVDVASNAGLALLIFGNHGLPAGKVALHAFVPGVIAGRGGNYPSIVCLRSKTVEAEQIDILRPPPNKEGSTTEGTKRYETMEATQENLRQMLHNLYTDPDFSYTVEPLNMFIEDTDEDKEFLDRVAGMMSDSINGESRREEKPEILYGNPTLHITFPPSVSKLLPETRVKAFGGHLNRLFNMPPGSKEVSWGEIDNALSMLEEKHMGGQFHLWTAELEAGVEAIRIRQEPVQIKQRLIAYDDHVYRPEIERYEVLMDDKGPMQGRVVIDLSFSDQVQDRWLVYASPEAAVAYNLAIAARIRHDIVGHYEDKVQELQEKDWAELKQNIESLLADGWFFMAMAQGKLNQALGREKLAKMGDDFSQLVGPDLIQGLDEDNRDKVASGLKKWSKNNQEFFHLALPWYCDQVGGGNDAQ